MDIEISRSEFIEALAATQDLIAPVVAGHGRRVAVFASLISEALAYTEEEHERLILAAKLHDIGCFPLSIKEKTDLHTFDVLSPQKHCAVGYVLLSKCSIFNEITRTILHHHDHWDKTQGIDIHDNPIPTDAYIIHLADRIDILIKDKRNILKIKNDMIRTIAELSGSLFSPKVVNAFKDIAIQDSFWLQGVHHEHCERIHSQNNEVLLANHLFELIDILTIIIDFKSRFTATHSSGVTATAMELGALVGYNDSLHLMIAGSLHDIGKLIIPNEILEKAGPLDTEERSLMYSHPVYTHDILSQIKGLHDVANTASFNQEKLNGGEYPFKPTSKQYDTPARIVAISDVFTSLTEDRPYRTGLQKGKALKILIKMAEDLDIAPDLFDVVRANYDYLNHARAVAQEEASINYAQFWNQAAKIMNEI